MLPLLTGMLYLCWMLKIHQLLLSYKQSFSRGPINVLLLYRSHTIGQNNFAGIIRYFLLRENDILTIFRDFNINALEGNDYMSQYLSNYKMIVTSPTHISGSLLHHVYVLYNFFENFKVTSYMKSVYFSDHDAVKCITEKVHE